MSSRFSYAKKLSFFISSKADELKAERQAVISAIRDMRMNPVFFEGFGARPGKPLEECLKEVERSDFYIGIFGNQYSSATETEYRKAKESGKPCLIYIKTIDEFKRDDKLTAFIKDLKTSHFYGLFQTPEELAARLKEDIARAITALVETERRERNWKDNLAPIEKVVEKAGSIYETQVLISLRNSLEELESAHKQLREWRTLQEKLQNLEIGFSPCYGEIARLKREGKTPRHLDVSAVEQAWNVCKRGPLSQLIEFAKGIKYIGEPLRIEVNGAISGGERWIIDLLKGQQKMDQSIERDNLGELFDSVSEFNNLINQYCAYVNGHLRRAIESLCESSSKLLGKFII